MKRALRHTDVSGSLSHGHCMLYLKNTSDLGGCRTLFLCNSSGIRLRLDSHPWYVAWSYCHHRLVVVGTVSHG